MYIPLYSFFAMLLDSNLEGKRGEGIGGRGVEEDREQKICIKDRNKAWNLERKEKIHPLFG